MSTFKTLPFPKHYNEKNNYESNYSPVVDYTFQNNAQDWKKAHNIKNSALDKAKIKILSIDNQRDFNFPDGSLYVGGRSGTGAMDAQKNAVEFIYKYLNIITDITSTLDTHFPIQIFFSPCHIDQSGNFVPPNTIISYDDYRTGKYQANPAIAKEFNLSPIALNKQFTYYLQELEKSGKYNLMIWPYHCLLGSKGHALAGTVEEAIQFHSLTRNSVNLFEIKGGSPYTEYYSIFAPEVKTMYDGRAIPSCNKNVSLINKLIDSNVVIIIGEASSHCVKESIKDLLYELKQSDESLLKKVYILKDCMASVVIPGIIDFTDDAEQAFKLFESEGMHVVESTTPIEDWPEINL